MMKTTGHLIGDRVSVRCRRSFRPADGDGDGDAGASWLSGRIIGRDAVAGKNAPRLALTRYVVQLDDDRRVVAFDDDVRRWTLAFDILENLEKMAS